MTTTPAKYQKRFNKHQDPSIALKCKNPWHYGWVKAVQRFLVHAGTEYNSVTKVWLNNVHKCLVKSNTNYAFSHKMEPNAAAFLSENDLSLYLPLYFHESYRKAPSLSCPLNQIFRERIQTQVLHKHLKLGKLFPQSNQAADLSLAASSSCWRLSWSLSWKFNQHWHILVELWFWLICSLLE